MKVGLKMQNITYKIDKLLRNHIYKIIVIHWISYEPFEQPGPERRINKISATFSHRHRATFKHF